MLPPHGAWDADHMRLWVLAIAIVGGCHVILPLDAPPPDQGTVSPDDISTPEQPLSLPELDATVTLDPPHIPDSVIPDSVPLKPCTVEVNGVVVKTVLAVDRNDCYKQTCFGSVNCTVYAQYFVPGTNLLEQFFDGWDKVNSDTCVVP